MLWKRLPSDVRLLALDEIEEELIIFREQKIMKYLHEKVNVLYVCDVIFHATID
jgi:hypothetical protein